MIPKSSELWTDTERIHNLFVHWDAICPVTKIHLGFSEGRTSKAPKFFVIAPENLVSHALPYAEWRYTSRAWTLAEAIEKAWSNQKVQRWARAAWNREFNNLIGMG